MVQMTQVDPVEALARQVAAFKLVAQNATRLLLDDQPEALIRDLFTQLGEHLGLEIFLNYLMSEDGTRLHLNACGGVSDELCGRLEWLQLGQGVCGTAAAQQRRIILEDAQRDRTPMTGFIREMGISAYAAYPLLVHGKLIGTLAFGSRTHRRFDSAALELMQVTADQVAVVMERKRLRVELQRRADELAEASAAKDRFLATLSHELRTPLTPILIAASALGLDDSLPERLREDMAMIRRNIELEARLIDDLLDLTRISRGKLQLHKQRVDAADLLARAIEMVRADADAKSLTIRIDAHASLRHVDADPARLQQVFWNLLKNAVKFTPAGGTISVRMVNESDVRSTGFSLHPNEQAKACTPNAALLIEFTDTGAGIDPALLPRLFNAFEQGECPTGRHHGGLGLGLAIAKALLDAHGGTIEAHSDGNGKGSTFIVKLPVVSCQWPAKTSPPSLTTDNSQPTTSALRILLVEDHPATAAVMARLLRSMGHAVRPAGSVNEALDAAAADRFDMIISDIGLPDGTGHELMRQLRNHQAAPAIAVSGFGMDNDIANSLEAGFAAHLTKPISIEQLEWAIQKVGGGGHA